MSDAIVIVSWLYASVLKRWNSCVCIHWTHFGSN